MLSPYIFTLCPVLHKILDRSVHTRAEAVVDPSLPREQAGFEQARSTVYGVTLQTQFFGELEGLGAPSATYDTFWH